ncbi:MFS transporter [Tanticharoenia sakaeratensis]|uniref:Sugar transport protein n=1 Tax=Tanticharoenia sakaeratensis NBRC 103193 TaxID=1231623 RepID=A0A0D6MJC0_9PROT|nr:MFS transporter [Tanticharoenia sakaeratensis]GAN53560.1 sugar transport protein [Tanticharoenia sakaeratensis NBRC 103193]GBQ17555.1 sugar transport protein [Tanticharoenia sakaeratensis NBRC 103193]
MTDQTAVSPPMSRTDSHGRQDVGSLTLLRPHWRVTFAAFMGWFLDAFDQTALMLAMPDIAHDFSVPLKAMGTVLLIQSIGRAIGNTGWGWLSDRYGRRIAFMAGVLWFAAFSGATAIATTYSVLVLVQFLFGIGFGGEWTASATLLMESVPARARPMASALMMSGYEVGYLVAAGVQAIVLPHYSWRWLFVIGLAPALLALFIRAGVGESPVWLKTRDKLAATRKPRVRFRFDAAAIQAVVIMTLLEFQKAAIFTFYPTILRGPHHLTPAQVFWPVGLYCIGSLCGKLVCGRIAERFGDVRVMLVALAIVVLVAWPFMSGPTYAILCAASFTIGAAASGVFALVPHYLSKRFPSETRSFGMGLGYAIGSIGQGVAAQAISLFGRGAALPLSAEGFVIGSSILSAAVALAEPAHLPGEEMEGEVT